MEGLAPCLRVSVVSPGSPPPYFPAPTRAKGTV